MQKRAALEIKGEAGKVNQTYEEVNQTQLYAKRDTVFLAGESRNSKWRERARKE